jgi:hypothetical protein
LALRLTRRRHTAKRCRNAEGKATAPILPFGGAILRKPYPGSGTPVRYQSGPNLRFLAAILSSAARGTRRGSALCALERRPTEGGMRRFTVAIAAALLVSAAPAYAQMGSGLGKGDKMGKGLADEKKDTRSPEQKKKDESAYKDAVGRIPDQKFDPWGKVR